MISVNIDNPKYGNHTGFMLILNLGFVSYICLDTLGDIRCDIDHSLRSKKTTMLSLKDISSDQ